MIKINVHTNILLAMLSWELELYHPYIPQNEAPHYVLISHSLQVNITKETWLQKNGHMKVQVKKREK
jgi:hypothetical protein